MIKLEHTIEPSGPQMEFVIEALRNPYNSWNRSDSGYVECEFDDGDSEWVYVVGDKDADLMKRLAGAGSDHRKYLRQIPVSVRITAPLYWWKEFDTYKTGTVANSCSTMHNVTDKEFTVDDFSCEQLGLQAMAALGDVIEEMNRCRDLYLNWKPDNEVLYPHTRKYYWWQIIQLLPSSYNQTRNVSLNYEVLYRIFKSRAGHPLSEWKIFIEWAEKLPYSWIFRV